MKIALCLFGLGTASVLVVTAEIVLRVAGIGTPAPLFMTLTEESEGRLVVTNQLFPLRFFFRRYEGKAAGVGQMNLQVFRTPKPEGTLRILLVGASTVQGFPHPRNLNAASFLRAYLHDLLPGRKIEVINIGTTALASFAVYKQLEAASDVQPDAVVAYLGHNEFFGAYGVASIMRAANSPLGCRIHYALRQSHLGQTILKLLGSHGPPKVTKKGLMEIMAALQYMDPEDSRRKAAYVNLKANLEAMAETARGWGVPFIVSTLVSNEKDLAPVRSIDPPKESRTYAEWRRLLDEGTIASLREAERLFPKSAASAYRLGRLLLSRRKFTEAAKAFRRAIDLDAMPWRATSQANEIIRSLAKKPNVFLADVESLFRDNSPHGILGDELLLDHVHPTTEGQALMARAFLRGLASARPELKIDPTKLKPVGYWRRRLGDCPPVQFHLIKVMGGLFSREPLAKNNRAKGKALLQRAQRFFESLHPAYRAAYKEWERLPRGMIKRPLIMVCADAIAQKTVLADADYAESARLFEASIDATPPYTPLRLEAVEKMIEMRKLAGFPVTDREKALAREAARMGRILLKTPLSDPQGVRELIRTLERFSGK